MWSGHFPVIWATPFSGIFDVSLHFIFRIIPNKYTKHKDALKNAWAGGGVGGNRNTLHLCVVGVELQIHTESDLAVVERWMDPSSTLTSLWHHFHTARFDISGWKRPRKDETGGRCLYSVNWCFGPERPQVEIGEVQMSWALSTRSEILSLCSTSRSSGAFVSSSPRKPRNVSFFATLEPRN